MAKLWPAMLSLVLLLGCKVPKDVMDSRNPSPKPATVVAPINGLEAYPGATEVVRKEGELGLSTPDLPEKVAAFYEPKLHAKAMPLNSGIMSIQNDIDGSHYQVDYGRFGDETTVTISVKKIAP